MGRRVTFQGVKSDPRPLTTCSPQGSTLSPTPFNALITVLISISLPPYVDILAYTDDDIAIISHGPRPAKKIKTTLDTTASKANDLCIIFFPAKTKIIASNTNLKQHNTFHIGRQDIEIVN